jgi:hypothetical protein
VSAARFASRHSRTATPTPPVPPVTGTLRSTPWLPFDMPIQDDLLASPRRVYPDLFVPHMLNVQAANDLTLGSSYYDKYFLPEHQPLPPVYDSTGKLTGNSKFNPIGGLYRNHPKRVPDQGSDFWVKNWMIQIKDSYDAGMSGFAVEILSPGTTALLAQQQIAAFTAVERLGLVGKFEMLMEIDISGGLKSYTATQLADVMDVYWSKPAQLKIAGKAQVVIFYPEYATAATWNQAKQIMAARGRPVEYIMCQVNASSPYYATFDAGNAAFAPISKLLGRWGDRDPITSGSNGTATSYLNRNLAKVVRSKYGKGAFVCVSPGDQRPNGKKWIEPRNTENFRVQWDAAINGEKSAGVSTTPPSGYQNTWHADRLNPSYPMAEMVGIHTLNDYAENSGVDYSRNTGYSWLDINAYYLVKYLLDYWPAIIRDCIYLSHKVEFTATTYKNTAQTAPQVHNGATASVDTVEALVFATGACTLEITGGTGAVTDTFTITGAGLWAFTAPMRAGAGGLLHARLVRGGSTVSGTSITSPWAISHQSWCTDKCIRIGSSLRGWQTDPIPPQPTHGVAIT